MKVYKSQIGSSSQLLKIKKMFQTTNQLIISIKLVIITNIAIMVLTILVMLFEDLDMSTYYGS